MTGASTNNESDGVHQLYPKLSIMVPILNEIELLPELLAHLQQWQRKGCEVLLVDSGSSDGSAEVAEAIGFTVLSSPRGRAKQMNAGADKVSINTAAIFNPELVKEAAERFGSQCIVVAMDVKDLGDGSGRYELFTHGGRKETGLEAVAWARKMAEFGAGEILLTGVT